MYVVLFLNINGIVILIAATCMNGFNVEYEKKCMEDLLFSICGLKFCQQKKSKNQNINLIIDSIFNKELMQYAVEHVAI